MRKLKDIEHDIEVIERRLEKYAMAYSALHLEMDLTIRAIKGQEAAASIEAEKLIERIKQ